MRNLILTLALFIGVSCNGNEVVSNGIQFGPSSARQEIRQFFRISGDHAKISQIHELARSRNIEFERLIADKSLAFCRISDRGLLVFEQYFGGEVDHNRTSLIYIVVSDDRGNVVCIETRHMTRGL